MTTMSKLPAALFAGALVLAATLATATEHGRTDGNVPYAIGGVGLDEVQALLAERKEFSLWVRTAARGSGEYLADVEVQIVDGHGATVFRQPLDGPWLLIALPPGTYRVQASWQGDTQARTVQVPRSGGREVMFYFDARERQGDTAAR